MADFTSFIIHLALSAESIYSPADANRILRSDSLVERFTSLLMSRSVKSTKVRWRETGCP